MLALRVNHEQILLPIAVDGAYDRLLEHLRNGWHVSSIVMKSDLRLLAVLVHDENILVQGSNVLGIDINAAKIAITIVNENGNPIRQFYFGQELQRHQIRFEERRAKLQGLRDSVPSSRAALKLKRQARRHWNHTHTSIWQLSKQIVDLARLYDANIAIEKLRGLRRRKWEWRKNQRKKANRIPYAIIRHALLHRAALDGRVLLEVSPALTSQRCPRCGNTTRRNRANWAYFTCTRCGYAANSDRVASLNICRRAARMMTLPAKAAINRSQVPATEVSVGGLVLQDEESETQCGTSPSCKPTFEDGQPTPSAPTV